MNNKDILLKEIDIIQSCINKVEQNSFVIKGWNISIVAVVLALFPENLNQKFISIALAVMTISFWLLDAFFLRVDRLYRWKYDWVVKNRLTSDNRIFDMNPYESTMWELDASGNTRKNPNLFFVLFSPTLLVVYIPLLCLSMAAFCGMVN